MRKLVETLIDTIVVDGEERRGKLEPKVTVRYRFTPMVNRTEIRAATSLRRNGWRRCPT